MFALPGLSPMTSPAASTEAVEGLSEDHEIATSARGLPIEVLAVAFGLIAPPTTTRLVAGRSMIVTGAGLTLIRAKPTLPATTAPTCASPGLKNEMVPELSALATSKGAANQTAGLTSSVLPDSSLATAVNFSCCPTSASATGEVTSTVLTRGASGLTGSDCCRPRAAVSINAITPRTFSFTQQTP